MTLKQRQIDRICYLYKEEKKGIGTIEKITRHSKNTIKKYLRLNGLLFYQYPSGPHRGPPNILDPSTWSTNEPQQPQGEWFYKEITKREEQITNLTTQITEKEKQDLQKEAMIKHLTEKNETTTKELEGYKKFYSASIDWIVEDEHQIEALKQQNAEIPKLKDQNDTLAGNLRKEQEENKIKNTKINDLENTIQQMSTAPPLPETPPTLQTQPVQESEEIPEDKETETPEKGIDWDLVALGGLTLIGGVAVVYQKYL